MPEENGPTKKYPSGKISDIMNISGDLVPELDAVTESLLELGKRQRVMILAGTEGGKGRKPYAITNIEIGFDNENDLRIASGCCGGPMNACGLVQNR